MFPSFTIWGEFVVGVCDGGVYGAGVCGGGVCGGGVCGGDVSGGGVVCWNEWNKKPSKQ